MKLFAESIRYVSGKLGVNTVRGFTFENQPGGKLKLDMERVNIFLPSNSTIERSYITVDPYSWVTEDDIHFIQEQLHAAGEITDIGLVADDIEIRHGLMMINQTIYGLEKGAVSDLNEVCFCSLLAVFAISFCFQYVLFLLA